ncbi:alpha-L-fucosidase [Rudaea cellulosilytica]|uniref:alpha-L-fucosidase n=1 Tax=Rudaea cellulosilytica TaxID=540746 RepID=UPI0003A2E449|nr:alpha-L-fucosidase [Rudaea cellulosilytica]
MATRRDILRGTVAGAISSLMPSLPSAFAAADVLYNNPPPGIGPLIPAEAATLKCFMGLRYGALLSWGPATVAGKEFSWVREVDIPAKEYDNFYKRFAPDAFDAEAWVRMMKDSGFRYVTFVTKHHDGFAMWDTKTTDYGVMNSPLKRDVLKDLAVACKKQKLALCLYYSIADLYQPDCIGANTANGIYLGLKGFDLPATEKPDFDRYVAYMKRQLKELSQNYGPVTAWWFDGGWMREWTHERGVDLLRYMRTLRPDTLANQRVGCAYNGRVYMPTWFPSDREYVGDFAVLEVDMPRFNRDIPWEYTTPANGRSYCWTAGPYLEPKVWLDNFVKSACGDGNYLLGISPPLSGRFDPDLVDKLAASNVWLKRYGDSLFETRGGPYKRTSAYGATCKGKRIYLHIFDTKLTTLRVPALPARILGCSLMNGGKASLIQEADNVTVKIDPNAMEAPSTIVVLDLDQSAEAIAPISEKPVNHGANAKSSNHDPTLDGMASDGDMLTAWKADGQTKQPWLIFDLGSERVISRAILFEGTYEGELANIHRYQIEVKLFENESWRRIADVTTWGFDTGQEEDFFDWPISVFHPEVRFSSERARFVRLKILKSISPPIVHQFELYER